MKSEHWQRLQPLLDRALELDRNQRSQFVASLGGEDAVLRDEVARLLAQHDHLGSQTTPDAMELAAPATLQAAEEDAELDHARVGQHVGPYRLARLLGAGGMGAVYLAERSADGFTQTVALKVVRRALHSQGARERFERERQILAGLKHPGIALLFDGGQTEEGQSFYTMEFVDGEPITDYCEHHDLTVMQRVRLLLQVAGTLSYAHRNLIVHRDIKPSNVLVTSDAAVKLIDFGLAKLLDEYTVPTITQTGMGPMTPVYAAPEQFLAKATTVPTDIYQFGALSFLVLTGRLPYRANTNDSLRWARAVLEEEPTTLARAASLSDGNSKQSTSRPDFGRLQRELSSDLDAIVRKCLAKSPDQRYRSADALIADMEAFVSGRPVAARPAGPLYFAWRFVQRHRYAVGATILAILALGIFGFAALAASRAAAEHAARADHEADVRDVTRAMLTDLLRVGPASATTMRPKSALEALDQGSERTLRALGKDLRHRAIASSVLAESYLELDHPQRARDLIEQMLPALDQRDDLRADAIQLDLLLGRAANELGDLATSKRALARVDTALELLGVPQDSPSRLAAAFERINLAEHEGDHQQAMKAAERLLRESDHPGLNNTLEFSNLLRFNAMIVDGASATDLLVRAWKIVAAHYGEDSPAALAAQRSLIAQDLASGHRFDTDRMLTEQETRVRESFGEKSLDYADVLTLRCDVADAIRQYAASEKCWRQVEDIYERVPDAEVLLATATDNLAAALVRLGRPAEALPYFQREIELRMKNFAPGHPNVIHARLQVAKTRCLMDDIDVATREFDTAIIDYVASVGRLHPYEAVYAAYFATCLLDAGHPDAARSIMDRHGRLDPPRKDMTDEDRADVQAVWDRLSH